MAKRISTPAKLTPPRLFAILPRERLFTLLTEKSSQHCLLWVSGPPGSGKTSLIASYLVQSRHEKLWYHLDQGDADLATFFHYLAIAAQRATGRRRVHLPPLAPEFLGDVPGFTRRFFRQLWSNIPTPAVLVLDDYQEVPADALLHQVVSVALSEFPPDALLVVISREQPPQQFAREAAHSLLGQVTWEELRLTLGETALLASSRLPVEPEVVRMLHEKSNGWVVGTMLMVEHLKTRPPSRSSLHSHELTPATFHYFAEEVYGRACSSVQEVLLRTAMLPSVTAQMAEAVSGNPSAFSVLRSYYRQGLFVDRRADDPVSYRYHDLFREFLLERGRASYAPDHHDELKRLAAKVADEGGELDTAAQLYAETKSWDGLSQLICRMSEQLLVQGRHQTLRGYLNLLPPEEVEDRPWVLYWSGISRLGGDPAAARKELEKAYLKFDVVQDDRAGRLLSIGGIIESFFWAGGDMAAVIPWGDRLQQLLETQGGFPSLVIEARVLMSLQGLIYACPQHALIREVEKKLDGILHALEDPSVRLGVALTFLNLFVWRGEYARARQILDDLALRISPARVPPSLLVIWKVMEAHHAGFSGNKSDARTRLAEAFAIADGHGIDTFKSMVRGCQLYHALLAGDDGEGERLAEMLLVEQGLHKPLTVAVGHFQRAGIALIRGDVLSAHTHAQLAVEITASLNLPYFLGNCRIGLAKVLIEMGSTKKARELLRLVIAFSTLLRSSMVEALCLLTVGDSYLRESRTKRANLYLQKGLEIARRNEYVALDYWWRPQSMAVLLAHALEAGIEVEYVRRVIKRRQLVAPSLDADAWPWPIQISTLGRFEILIDNVSQHSAGKSQRKPLELLQCLCAAGEQGIHQRVVHEFLWPDADGVAADQAFRTTLHRLRKLLRYEDSVQVADGHLTLNMALVRVDNILFERRVQQVNCRDVTALEKLCHAYRGHFLPGEVAAWALPVRERLRAHYLILIERLGALLEERDELPDAAQKYLSALEVEPAAEVMCRRVMRTYVRLGRRSEAIGVYQRFSQVLRTKLGIAPTPETVSLYDNITKT